MKMTDEPKPTAKHQLRFFSGAVYNVCDDCYKEFMAAKMYGGQTVDYVGASAAVPCETRERHGNPK
jgi:hypothetical protein